MSLGPILPGRIPNSLMGANFVSDLTSIDDALNKVENQISSGQQYSLPSDNPTATISGIDLQEQLRSNAQDTTNVTTDQGFLGATDSALQNVSSSLSQANALLLSGIGATTNTAEKQSLATQVNTIIQGLVNTANSTFQGRYIFGGSQSTTPPFTTTQAGIVRYNGDQFSINSYVDPKPGSSATMEINSASIRTSMGSSKSRTMSTASRRSGPSRRRSGRMSILPSRCKRISRI